MTAEKKLCCITGVAGNVGSKLCRALLDAGVAVVGVDNFFSGYRSNLAEFADHPDFSFEERSILEKGLLPELTRRYGRFAAVLHMAAVVSVPWSMEHPEETMAVNLDATLALHEAARDSGAQSFVFAGSAAEYGLPVAGAVRESQAGEPQSPYGVAKFRASQHIAASGFGCALRFFNLYGPARGKPGPYDGVVRRFMAMALNAQPLTIFGDGNQTRDFVWVYDAVQTVLLAAGLAVHVPQAAPVTAAARPLCGVYNAGTGRSITVTDLAALLIRLAGHHLPITYLPGRAGDLRHSLADTTALTRSLGCTPATTLEDGLAKTMAWFSENRAELV